MAESKLVNLEFSSREIHNQRFNLRNVRRVSNLDLTTQSLEASHLQGCGDLHQLRIPFEVHESSTQELIANRCRLS